MAYLWIFLRFAPHDRSRCKGIPLAICQKPYWHEPLVWDSILKLPGRHLSPWRRDIGNNIPCTVCSLAPHWTYETLDFSKVHRIWNQERPKSSNIRLSFEVGVRLHQPKTLRYVARNPEDWSRSETTNHDYIFSLTRLNSRSEDLPPVDHFLQSCDIRYRHVAYRWPLQLRRLSW